MSFKFYVFPTFMQFQGRFVFRTFEENKKIRIVRNCMISE